jgi:beta-aspartyl-peptidase (threonine type)
MDLDQPKDASMVCQACPWKLVQVLMPETLAEEDRTVQTHRRRFSPLLIALLVLFVALTFLLNLYSARAAKDRASEERQAIQAVLDAQVVAWNRGDLVEFMGGYWHSPELTFFSGKEVHSGWQAAFDRYRKRYQAEGRDKMGTLSFSDIKIDLLGPDSAVVLGHWKLVTSKEPLGGLFTLIFKKKSEGWRIVHDHTSG